MFATVSSWVTLAQSQNLVKHLNYLRESFGIPLLAPNPPPVHAPKARKPVPNIDVEPTSPYLNRVSRLPTIPGINEEEEPSAHEPFYTTGEDNYKPTTPHRKKTKVKSMKASSNSSSGSSSKLPMPARPNTPAIRSATVATTDSDLEPVDLTTAKKPSRRQSGLLSVRTEALTTPRSGSPAFGSPIRLEAGGALGPYSNVENAIASDVEGSDSPDSKVRDKKTGDKKTGCPSQPPLIQDDEARHQVTSRRRKERPDEQENGRTKAKETSRTALQPIDPNGTHTASQKSFPFLILTWSPQPCCRGARRAEEIVLGAWSEVLLSDPSSKIFQSAACLIGRRVGSCARTAGAQERQLCRAET